MSGILYAVGALTVVVGLALAGFGIPVKEFSFGNTLIQAGVTAAVGGLIIAALGVVAAQLQRVSDALTAKSPIRSTRPMDMFDTARAARVPFPAKPKMETPAHEPFAHEPHVDQAAEAKPEETGRSLFAPSLRNPEETHVTVEDEVSLSPQHEEGAPQSAAHEPEVAARHAEPDAGWRPAARPAHTNYFDAMWPSESKDGKDTKTESDHAAADEHVSSEARSFEPKAFEDKAFEPEPIETKSFEPKRYEPKRFEAKRFEPKPFSPKPLFDPKPYEPKTAEPKFQEPRFEDAKAEEPKFEDHGFEEPTFAEAEAGHPHTEEPAHTAEAPVAAPVGILKSGVVDGMAYTLYVDGSIEAELPQGTLRFASINELRAHLEKTA